MRRLRLATREFMAVLRTGTTRTARADAALRRHIEALAAARWLAGYEAGREAEADAYLAGVRDGLDGGIDMALNAIRERQNRDTSDGAS